MPSTVIKTFSYVPGEQALDVQFQTGRHYRYHDVPAEEAEAMRAAFSKGVYFNEHIRDRYRYTRTR